MSRFLNKKEEVIDLKLTSYGKYLLGLGSFKPVYYAFFDDNVVYDAEYFGRQEVQNAARKRIKDETQYLEGLVLFRDLGKDSLGPEASKISYFELDVTPTQKIPRKDIFRFDKVLGDAHLQGETQMAPAWKVVALQAPISSSAFMDVKNNTRVPQINITASYDLKIMSYEDYYNESFNSDDLRKLTLVSEQFTSENVPYVVYLDGQDPLIYVEEVNTELLTENYEIEVFEYVDGSTSDMPETLERKYFKREIPQIVDGLMVTPTQEELPEEMMDTGSVQYYFDILRDADIDREVACLAAAEFNKETYYVDLDFDCEATEGEDIFFDIYGQATEPEICQD